MRMIKRLVIALVLSNLGFQTGLSEVLTKEAGESSAAAVTTSSYALVLQNRESMYAWWLERTENESVSEMVANLAKEFPLVCFSNRNSARDMAHYVVRKPRVKKLLELGRSGNEDVQRELTGAIETALKEWGSGRYRVLQEQTLVATYVLAELGHHAILPILVKSYEMTDSDPLVMVSPVPTGFTLYAMYRLLLSYPEDELTEASQRLLREALDRAEELLFPIAEIDFATVESLFDSGSVQEKRRLRYIPYMGLPIYRTGKTKPGGRLSNADGIPYQEANLLFEKFRDFVQAIDELNSAGSSSVVEQGTVGNAQQKSGAHPLGAESTD
jgi:hypothetical protein